MNRLYITLHSKVAIPHVATEYVDNLVCLNLKLTASMILFTISLCWSSALHPATEILDDSQKLSAVQKQCTQCQVWDLLFSPTKAVL